MRPYAIVDTETTGFRWWGPDRVFLIGERSDGKNNLHWSCTEGQNHRLPGGTHLVFHNAKFDIHMLRAVGTSVDIDQVVDTQILAHLAGEEELGLKALAGKYFGDIEYDKPLKDWLKAEARRWRKEGRAGIPNYSHVPKDMMEVYLAKDLEYTDELYNMWYEALLMRCPDQLAIEHRLIRLVLDIEQRGIAIDATTLRTRLEEITYELDQTREWFRHTLGSDFNPNSPLDLAHLLFDRLHLPIRGRTPTGKPSLDSITLASYGIQEASKVLDYRRLGKIKGTYLEAIDENVRSNVDGRLRGGLRQNGTITGRFSSRDPNLQNIPRRDVDVRQCIKPSSGNVLVFADYSQIEMRIFASLSRDDTLIQCLLRGEDLHERTQLLLGLGDLGKPGRQIAKTINFGVIYGMGAKKLSESLSELYLQEGGEFRAWSLEECKDLLRRYQHAYPAAKSFMDRMALEARRVGYVEDLWGKRYRLQGDWYKATNYLVQGSAAQVLKRAMLRMSDKYPIINCIHDELILDIPEGAWYSNVEATVVDIQWRMEERALFWVPLLVEVSWSNTSWAEKRPALGVSSSISRLQS